MHSAPPSNVPFLHRAALSILMLAGVTTTAHAAPISIADNPIYTQNFDTLGSADQNHDWDDGETIPGWHSGKGASSGSVWAVYKVNDGSKDGSWLYSWGSSGSGERALGSLVDSSAEVIAYGVVFHNDTGADLNFVTVTYDGEQWRVASESTQKLAFYYRMTDRPIAQDGFSLHLTTSTWTAHTDLDFTSPVTSATAGPVDGNTAGKVAGISDTINFVLPAGSYLWIGWRDEDDSGSAVFDHGLAIDNLTIAFTFETSEVVPEPGTVALVALGVALMTHRVRKRSA